MFCLVFDVYPMRIIGMDRKFIGQQISEIPPEKIVIRSILLRKNTFKLIII